jgi:hypothetical protein
LGQTLAKSGFVNANVVKIISGPNWLKLATNGKVALAQRLFADKKHSIDDICSTLGISRLTLYCYVREGASPVSDL